MLTRPPLQRIFGRPFPCSALKFCPIALVNVRNFRIQWVVRVRVGQQRRNGKKHSRNCERRAPLVFQNIEANTSIPIYIWMVNFCSKIHFGGFKWIISRKVDVEEKKRLQSMGCPQGPL